MSRSIIDVPMRDSVRALTLHLRVTGVPVARLRMAIGAQFVRLGAWIIGCGVEIEAKADRPSAGQARS